MHRIRGFTITLSYSRRMLAQAVPEEIPYDRMRTVWLGQDERGEIVWHPVFPDFARYWKFRPRLCRPCRAQTKGKIEWGVKFFGNVREQVRHACVSAVLGTGDPIWRQDRRDRCSFNGAEDQAWTESHGGIE